MATVNSARSNYRETVTVPDGTGKIIVLANVEANIYQPGTTTRVNVYGSRNPSDVTPLPNPIVTDATGIVNFWSEVGEYDIVYHDRNVPARIGDQTIGWSSVSPIDKGIPSAKVRDDNGLAITSQASDTARQWTPLGSVIDWWRPSSTYDAGAGAGNPPPGWEICDGRTILGNANDITPGTSLLLPDLRNKFILGADPTKADGSSDATTAAASPGIRGTGGGHTVALAATEMPTHNHVTNINDPGHRHSWSNRDAFVSVIVAGTYPRNYNEGAGYSGGVAWNTEQLQLATTGITASTNNAGGGASHENRPAYYGLLKIMKVRRS